MVIIFNISKYMHTITMNRQRKKKMIVKMVLKHMKRQKNFVVLGDYHEEHVVNHIHFVVDVVILLIMKKKWINI